MTREKKRHPLDIPIEVLNMPVYPALFSYYYLPFVNAAVAVALPLLSANRNQVPRNLVEHDLVKLIQIYAQMKRRHRGPTTAKDVCKELKKFHSSILEAQRIEKTLSKEARIVFGRWSLLPSALDNAIRDMQPYLNRKIKAGAPNNPPLEEATRKLVELWVHWQPETYKKSLTIARSKSGQQEFVSPGPRFVGATLMAIDPSIAISQIDTALRKLPPIQEYTVSE